MRFDDMIATVLRQSETRPSALAAKWRQLVDLVAQGRTASDTQDEAIAWLRDKRAYRRAQRQVVSVVAESGSRIAVSGIEAGARVIDPLPASLQDGARVEVRP